MTGWRRWAAGIGLVTSLALLVSACQVDGIAQPDPAAVAAVQASLSTGVEPVPPVGGSSGPTTTGTIEDHSTNPQPPTTSPATPTADSGTSAPGTTGSGRTAATPTGPATAGPTTSSRTTAATTTASGPALVLADDGFAVSIMVTTIWARALIGRGAKVGIRTIDDTAGQVAALRAGQVDIVQQYNSGLLNYLDDNADAVGQSAVDAAIAAKLPAGLTVLRSTPARDDVQLVVSAATAAKYRLHSITDLAGHLADLTLLLTDDKSAKAFSDGLSNYYGLTFPNTRTTDFAGPKMIAAVKAGGSVGLMVASQYQIDDNRFVVLTDPEHLFLTENFIPLVGGKKVTVAMRATLDAVSAKLSLSTLRGLRKKVATGEGTFTEVADQWLASVGLR